MKDIITFQSFYSVGEAIELSLLLSKNGVDNRIKKPNFFDQYISPDSLLKEFHVQINEEDLIKANNILENLK